MRVGTWNLERPALRGQKKNSLRMNVLRERAADLWVLTETSEAIHLDGYLTHCTPTHETYHRKGEHGVSVLTTWPVLRTLETWDKYLSVCLEVTSPIGPALVYGTIITYANDRGPENTSKRWVEHRKAVEAQGKEWFRLRQTFPSHFFIVAGDFNQSRDGSGWYEDNESVALLSRYIQASDLRCATEGNLNEEFHLGRSTIDHICVGPSSRIRGWTVSAWPGTIQSRRLSDHNGVLVQVDA